MSARDFKYDVRELIECVKANPCIWNRKLEIYKDKGERRAGWEQVFRQLDDEYDTMPAGEKRLVESAILEKWKNVKDTFLRALKNKDGKPKKKYLHHDKLLFLQPMFPEIDFNQYCTENAFEFNDSYTNHDQDQDTVEDVAVYTHSNDADATTDADDDSYYEPKQEKKKKTEKHSFVIKKHHDEDIFEPAKEPDMLDASGLDATVMNEDEAFFASLLPTVVRYNEDERLEFRIKVLAVMKDIRNKITNGYS